jgi:adenine phosphoribosyltransferase/phosphomevalonate kinase
VVTGVWPRDKEDPELVQSLKQWVYSVAKTLLPLSCGAYGADLGPDPRDAALAARAFGPNLQRLAQLKNRFDPHNVLAFACPVAQMSAKKLIVLITGESCAGKDHCASIWSSVLVGSFQEQLSVRVVSISDATKREYAAATNSDLDRLLGDRAYKERHRSMLTSFFQEQVRLRPLLPEEHFLDVVHDARNVDVLLVTGMRDNAPVATFSHLVPESRLVEIHIQATEQTRLMRGSSHGSIRDGDDQKPSSTVLEHCSTLIFRNDISGNAAVEALAEHHLLPFLHHDLDRLAKMVRSVSNFPRSGIEFRHVLGISQRVEGLSLCANLLHSHFRGNWAKVDTIACYEVGGCIFASALALQTNVPLVLNREAGRLPPPKISVPKPSSYISSTSDNSNERRIEMGRDAIATGASVVVADDVLSTGKTLCAVLELLQKADIDAEHIRVMVVAEFPVHCGRRLLHQRGFGKVNVQSLLVFGGS